MTSRRTTDSPSRLTVLSVRQPWASLLLTGEDWCENRSWTTEHRGPLWIHASSKIETKECDLWRIDRSALPTGAIIGCVELVDILPINKRRQWQSKIIHEHRLNADVGPQFICGEFCWIVKSPRLLKRPIPALGRLNLWKYEAKPAEIREFAEATPLIAENTRKLATSKSKTVTIAVNGRKESVSISAGLDSVGLYFKKRVSSRIAKGPDSWQYEKGEPHYRAACEKAWELFPESFATPSAPGKVRKRK